MVTVLLYYQFVLIDNPPQFAADQRRLAESLELKGRILVGEEGINGTLAGSEEGINAYKQAMWADQRFAQMSFKESKSGVLPFPKLKVKLRPEIISLYQSVDVSQKAPYISPKELHELYATGEEFYLLDARNDYESEVGAFEGAITPAIPNFRDLPASVKNLPFQLKNKKLITYCTGGIRCEKASALLKQEGFEEVYQLEGGIVNYIMQYPEAHFKGDCYVFDDRMQVTQAELAKYGVLSQAPQSQPQ